MTTQPGGEPRAKSGTVTDPDFAMLFGIEPQDVDRTAHELEHCGSALHGTGISLPGAGSPDPRALPGGQAAPAIATAAAEIGGTAMNGGQRTVDTAASLLSFVSAVTTADAESAEALSGTEPAGGAQL